MVRFADPTVVISRSGQTERREAFNKQADAIGLQSWGYFDAFDGERMQLSTLAGSAHGREGRPAPQPLKPTELGCLLSHLAIVRAAEAFHIQTIAILEDDIQFSEDFCDHWEAFMAEVPADWIMIHGAGDHGGMPETAMPQPVSPLVCRVGQSYGTRFMLMRREAILRLSMHSAAHLCSEPADWLLLELFATERVYTPRKWLMRHR